MILTTWHLEKAITVTWKNSLKSWYLGDQIWNVWIFTIKHEMFTMWLNHLLTLRDRYAIQMKVSQPKLREIWIAVNFINRQKNISQNGKVDKSNSNFNEGTDCHILNFIARLQNWELIYKFMGITSTTFFFCLRC